MAFSPQELDQISNLLLSEEEGNKLLGYQLLSNASKEDIFALQRVLIVATYLSKNFTDEIEGHLELLMADNFPAAQLYQLQNEIIILDYARYKFNVKGGWHTPQNPLHKYLYLHEKQLDKYLPIFKKNEQKFAQYYWMLAGRIQKEMQSHKKALFYYELALKVSPSHKSAKLGVAKIVHQYYIKKGKKIDLYPTILQYYLDGFSSKEKMFSYIQGALLCADVNDFEKSRQIYMQGLEINPKETVLLNNYANLLYKEFGDFAQAKELVKEGIKIQPDSYLWDTLANIEMLGYGNLETAKELFTKALLIDGSNHASHTGLGDLYILLKDYKKAEKHYQKGLFNGMQFTTKEKKDVVEKLQKIVLLYTTYSPDLAKANYYQSKLAKLTI